MQRACFLFPSQLLNVCVNGRSAGAALLRILVFFAEECVVRPEEKQPVLPGPTPGPSFLITLPVPCPVGLPPG